MPICARATKERLSNDRAYQGPKAVEEVEGLEKTKQETSALML